MSNESHDLRNGCGTAARASESLGSIGKEPAPSAASEGLTPLSLCDGAKRFRPLVPERGAFQPIRAFIRKPDIGPARMRLAKAVEDAIRHRTRHEFGESK